MKQATIVILVVLCVLTVLGLSGCGNVTLKGDSMTAAEISTQDAFNAAQRAVKDPNIPNWTKAYLDENFKQWRCFVWSAKKDVTWGPKLPSESATGGPAPGTKAGG